MNFAKKILRILMPKFQLVRFFYFRYLFFKRNKYWPDFKNPKTYNEKINLRKREYKHELFSVCSDKIKAKEYVAEKVGDDVVIENYFVGDSISAEKIKEILNERGDFFLKANHNSGPVQLISSESTDEQIREACKSVNEQLDIDFGKIVNERWYSDITPRILAEKSLEPSNGETDIKDYKFHCFKQGNGYIRVVLHVDYDRNFNHNRSFFEGESLDWLPFSLRYPAIYTKLKVPENYQKMLEIAKKLAEPFSYVRVDLYNVNGNIYFGEMTFAHGSGAEEFSAYCYDEWMGNYWTGDPRY
ncbi:ATP-grasp fold amidoligase family protein [Sedimentisphaera salicampi]|uniref:Uncharacterized protein n=1 Tax=Sedimentisphaera salicampi TaxID=1941349 RepID=A0A1W6LKM5_9BACT|nr:ATP-grasp fold amidoligase family protein [Sedimentisphaera salicampi]ARN56293.1 hypothetical protein STSP1_00669 [Sedimentisphaera salicampi]